ncbi:MAG: type II toxin-antitoxin system RelE/ParE family toxin [Pyrinomonadaceae bacterium]|nr:type II toxin-antitoxin system RelE/ParE family toxin [Pyrinomonadaceae bacterium]
MKYAIEFKPRALKDLESIDKRDAQQILRKIRLLENDLFGDVKRLKNFDPKFRLRIGVYRALFNIVGNTIFVYRVVHRSEAY